MFCYIPTYFLPFFNRNISDGVWISDVDWNRDALIGRKSAFDFCVELKLEMRNFCSVHFSFRKFRQFSRHLDNLVFKSDILIGDKCNRHFAFAATFCRHVIFGKLSWKFSAQFARIIFNYFGCVDICTVRLRLV